MVTTHGSEVRGASATPESRIPEQRGRGISQDARKQAPVVLLVDPDDTTRAKMHAALAGHCLINAGAGAEVEELIMTVEPGPLAMVKVHDRGSAPGVIRALRSAGWQRVLALADCGTEIGQVLSAVSAGAGGVIGLNDPGHRAPHPLDPSCRLSPRELEVVRLVAEGMSNKAIGQRLSLSSLTVKNHLARVGRRLGTGDRAHIVAIACRAGLIGADN